jgi:hypothetical protein
MGDVNQSNALHKKVNQEAQINRERKAIRQSSVQRKRNATQSANKTHTLAL